MSLSDLKNASNNIKYNKMTEEETNVWNNFLDILQNDIYDIYSDQSQQENLLIDIANILNMTYDDLLLEWSSLFRTLSKHFHPDLGGNEIIFKKLSAIKDYIKFKHNVRVPSPPPRARESYSQSSSEYNQPRNYLIKKSDIICFADTWNYKTQERYKTAEWLLTVDIINENKLRPANNGFPCKCFYCRNEYLICCCMGENWRAICGKCWNNDKKVYFN
jgi:hypothetical protein